MNQLDDESNSNLFKLIKFLKFYYLSNTVQNQINYQKVIDSYGRLVKKINRDIEDYKKRVEEKLGNSHEELHNQHIDSWPQYIQMINDFNSLPNLQQKNVLNLGLFILYCKINKLDHPPDPIYIWEDYSQLMGQIKSLPINE